MTFLGSPEVSRRPLYQGRSGASMRAGFWQAELVKGSDWISVRAVLTLAALVSRRVLHRSAQRHGGLGLDQANEVGLAARPGLDEDRLELRPDRLHRDLVARRDVVQP